MRKESRLIFAQTICLLYIGPKYQLVVDTVLYFQINKQGDFSFPSYQYIVVEVRTPCVLSGAATGIGYTSFIGKLGVC